MNIHRHVFRWRSAGKLWAALLLLAAGLVVIGPEPSARCAPGEGATMPDTMPDTMTPYARPVDGSFMRGATLDLAEVGHDPAAVAERLQTMRDRFGIDTVGLYDLAEWEPAGTHTAKDALFATLNRLNMRVVPRIEAYDPESFAFDQADVDDVAGRYTDLLAYLGAPARRPTIAYLAVNLPLDDPRVQQRLGGVNSPVSVQRQQNYARAIIQRLRALTGAPVFLGVFYGWDNTYRPPSYRSAGADGYFLTSYSYPGAVVPDETATEAALIDAPRRHAAMRHFVEQYGPDTPVVVEYGVQTAEPHASGLPAQPAGLVRDRAAKQRALAATTRFYCSNYPGVRGTMYFGFNVYKAEGDPPATLDFGLDR